MAYDVTAHTLYPRRTNHDLRLYVRRLQTDDAGNRSRYAWQLIARRTSGLNAWWNDPSAWSVNIGGQITNGRAALAFTNARPEIVLGGGETGWFTHDGNGYLTIWVSANHDGGSNFGFAQTASTRFDTDRIPKPPQSPVSVRIDEVTASSLRYVFSGRADNGAPILEWQAQLASDAGFTRDVRTVASNGTTTFADLPAGVTYWVRSRGRNRMGWGGWSNALNVTVGLPAPTLTSWAQNARGELVATWTPPDATNGLIGYRLQIATDDRFTAGVSFHDTGDVLSAAIGGKAGGRRYFARVAARTAGGVNSWSAPRDIVLVLDPGDTDGWLRIGTRPENVAYFTATGLRRSAGVGAGVLHLESISTGAGSIPLGSAGLQRRLTGLTPGASYRFTAQLTAEPGSLSRAYQLGVGTILGDAVTAPEDGSSVALPPLEFVATATSVMLRIVNAEDVLYAGPDADTERAAFTRLVVAELDTDVRQRLRDTVYESNLANHFDLACNSVGATWYVDTAGVTRFIPTPEALPLSAIFSDRRQDGALEYVDIAAGYDTLATINRIEASNYGIGEDGLEDNQTLVVEDRESQQDYGIQSARVDVNLYDQPPYDSAFADRLQQLLDDHSEPELFVSEIRWNAQEDMSVLTRLDIGQRVRVRYRDTWQDSQIVSLLHHTTGTRWMTSINLLPLRGITHD